MRQMVRFSMVIMAAIIAVWGWGNVANAQDSEVTAAVHGGLCDNLGDEVAALNSPQPESGSWIGVEGLGQILESESDDVVPGQDLINAPHAIVIFSGGDIVACGEVGGYPDDDDLYIGLQTVGDSGYFGIAELDDLDDDDDAEIDLYVFQPAS